MNFFAIFLAQHGTSNQTNYRQIDQYNLTNQNLNSTFAGIYAGALKDLELAIEGASANGLSNQVAMAKIMQAYLFQGISDFVGDVPFTQALDASISAPLYESQETVYQGIIQLLDEALAEIDKGSEDNPGTADLIFAGDIEKWRRFANTLKLRVYLRMSNVDPSTAASGIAALGGASFLSSLEDEPKVAFFDDFEQKNPLFLTDPRSDRIVAQQIVASSTIVDYMNALGDPRRSFYFEDAVNLSDVALPGIYSGAPNGMNNDERPLTVSRVHPFFVAADAPVVFMTFPEALFLQAEAVEKGFLTGNAEALYQEAITASMQQFGISNIGITTYLGQSQVTYPTADTQIDRLRAIMTQKWLALYIFQSTEAWAERRRTGFPDFQGLTAAGSVSFSSPLNSFLGDGAFPLRLLYPADEVAVNPNVQTTGLPPVTTPVWWDVD